jgi:hypothetical protein
MGLLFFMQVTVILLFLFECGKGELTIIKGEAQVAWRLLVVYFLLTVRLGGH